MFTSFSISQQLHNLFQPPQLPEDLLRLSTSFYQTIGRDLRGTHQSEDFAQEPKLTNAKGAVESPLARTTYNLLEDWYHRNDPLVSNISRNAILQASICAGVVYKTATRSKQDSHVIFRLKGDPQHDRWRAGSITMIFQHRAERQTAFLLEHQTTFLLVEPFKYAEPEPTHPHFFHHESEFSSTTGFLFYVQNRLPPVLITLDEVIGHFAYAETDYIVPEKDKEGKVVGKHALFQVLPL